MSDVLMRIAFRNLRQHKTKTFIIGILITLGIAILVVGNSFIDTIQQGIEKNYINNYTGNLFIAPTAVKQPSLLISQSAMETVPKVIPDFEKVRSYAESLPGVTGTTGQINGMATAKWGETGDSFALLLGVNSASYIKLFPEGIKLLEGTWLPADGSEGIVLSRTVAEVFEETANKEIHPGEKIVLTTINAVSGTKIREVTVRGIHDYGDSSFDLSMICFLDETNLRIMGGMVLNSAETIALTDSEKASLGELDEEDLFGTLSDDSPLTGGTGSGDGLISQTGLTGSPFEVSLDASPSAMPSSMPSGVPSDSMDDSAWLDILGDTSERAFLNATNPSAWNYLLVKVSDHGQSDKVIRQLNQYFKQQGIEARAWAWIDGAGMSAQLANTISIVFNILLFIIAVVALIVIMNTLVISVSERFGEIGTMRAIGAKKSFVRKMITWETLMISVVFGLLGVIIGIIALLIMRAVGIEASNQFMQILLGGQVFRPAISYSAIVSSLVTVSAIGVLASLYPVSVALKITPLEAMNKN